MASHGIDYVPGLTDCIHAQTRHAGCVEIHSWPVVLHGKTLTNLMVAWLFVVLAKSGPTAWVL